MGDVADSTSMLVDDLADGMPATTIAGVRVSRLIAGANTINGGSHLSRFVNQQMRRYFTPDRVMAHLQDCVVHGINTWQSGPGNLDLLDRFRRDHGDLQYISLGSTKDDGDGDIVDRLRSQGVFAVAHHGEVTDQLFRQGRVDELRGFLQRVREAGLAVGVSTHIPEVIDYIESAGWDLDFYMCCVYERLRTREQLMRRLGHVPLPVGEVYLEDDPPLMFAVMRATERPCLAFKILGAGRLCERQETVEAAFQSTFSQIKANDGVIVGMYPEFEDQVELNTSYVRRFAST